MNCDPNALMAAARCVRCIPSGMLPEVQLYLICKWAGAVVVPNPPSPVVTNIIQISGAGEAGVNQIYTRSGNGWISADGLYTINAYGDNGIRDQTGHDLYGSINFPFTWEDGHSGLSPAPTGVYLNSIPSNIIAPNQVIVVTSKDGYCFMLVVDLAGDLGTIDDPGPGTPVRILDDGSGGFWKIVVDADGNRGTEQVVGPATSIPVLNDISGGHWQVVADATGNLGTLSV